jgi:hypothetical protein
MGDHRGTEVRRLRAPMRRIAGRLAEVACPPGAREWQDALMTEFEALLAVVPSGTRTLIQVGLASFDQGARLYPPSRGRRFTRLSDARADQYFRAVLASKRGGAVLQQLKALVVFCYYELPEVKHQLGYRPEPYIAIVSRRRLDSYGAEIRAGEQAVLADPAGGTP